MPISGRSSQTFFSILSIVALISVSGCLEPTASGGLSADYTLISTREGGSLPDLLFYTKDIGWPPDTLGYVDRGSIHFDGSSFVATFDVRRSSNPAAPVETVRCTGKFKVQSQYDGGSPFDLSAGYKHTVIHLKDQSGLLLGHHLGKHDAAPEYYTLVDWDGFPSDDFKTVTIFYQEFQSLTFIAN